MLNKKTDRSDKLDFPYKSDKSDKKLKNEVNLDLLDDIDFPYSDEEEQERLRKEKKKLKKDKKQKENSLYELRWQYEN